MQTPSHVIERIWASLCFGVLRTMETIPACIDSVVKMSNHPQCGSLERRKGRNFKEEAGHLPTFDGLKKQFKGRGKGSPSVLRGPRSWKDPSESRREEAVGLTEGRVDKSRSRPDADCPEWGPVHSRRLSLSIATSHMRCQHNLRDSQAMGTPTPWVTNSRVPSTPSGFIIH